jgi:hypothetical protein
MKDDAIVNLVADLTHKKFQSIYKNKNGGSRVKTTKDQDWIDRHDSDQADLAKLSFIELPNDWKFERWSGAKVAWGTVQEAVKSNKPLDRAFIEYASDLVHKDWLTRNVKNAQVEHTLAYRSLSEEAKEKDRIFVTSALEIYNNMK